jgi:pilus assembly protein CpaC
MSRHPRPGLASLALLTVLFAAHGGTRAAHLFAQDPQTPPAERLALIAGKSVVVRTPFDIARFQLADTAVADGAAIGARELLVVGKKVGTISLLIWDRASLKAQYDVVVESGAPTLQEQLAAVFPGEPIQANTVGTAVVLTGVVGSQDVADRIVAVAEASGLGGKIVNLLRLAGDGQDASPLEVKLRSLFPTEDLKATHSGNAIVLTGTISTNTVLNQINQIVKASEPDATIVDLMKLREAAAVQQVMLEVRIAEVGRNALLEAGASLSASGANSSFTGATTTQQFPPQVSGQPQFAQGMNVVLFHNPTGLALFIRLLQQSGTFQSLAEPNLIAYNGREARFLSGGKLPIVIPGSAGSAPLVQWEPYGVSLAFTPQILGDRIHLTVRPEVSAVDLANGVNVGGTFVPALTTRTVQTEVDLRDGQSFAIAGLLSSDETETKSGVPGLAHVPLLGYLFKSKSRNSGQSELLVIVTPRLVEPLKSDQVPVLPTIKKDGKGGGGR